MYPSFTTEVNF